MADDTTNRTDVPALPATAGQLTVPAHNPPLPPAPTPKKRRWWIWAALVVVVLTGAALWYFQPWVSKGLAVTTETDIPAPLIRVLAVNGRLAPLHPVDVKPATGGEVLAVQAAEGDQVAQGAVLARIDASAQQTVVRQALAGLDAGLKRVAFDVNQRCRFNLMF